MRLSLKRTKASLDPAQLPVLHLVKIYPAGTQRAEKFNDFKQKTFCPTLRLNTNLDSHWARFHSQCI